jgi:hypothetical protein
MILAANTGNATVSWYDNDNVLKYLIPTVVALIVFVLGVIASWLKDNIARRREVKNLKNVVTQWVPNLKDPVDFLVESCTAFSKAAGESKELGAQGMKFNQLYADKLGSISLESMIRTFVTNSTGKKEDNNKYLFNIVSALSFLEKKEPEIIAKYNEHYTSANELLGRWNEAFDRFSDANIELLDSNAEMEAHPQNTKVSYTELVEPFDELLSTYIQNNGFDYAVIGELSSTLQDLKIIYAQWIANSADYASVFAAYAKQLNNSYGQLAAGVAYFNDESKIKLICS